ncbi:uncharacterized protein LOC134843867 isoform X2 [Symsagittifera roscoffensis]|uniref:uncharacterized protein LOC134843867 isoform X2 n=1 Tax=Symsagittifera roscoffensis TaxID=84072 RepID=UPI00307C14D6
MVVFDLPATVTIDPLDGDLPVPQKVLSWHEEKYRYLGSGYKVPKSALSRKRLSQLDQVILSGEDGDQRKGVKSAFHHRRNTMAVHRTTPNIFDPRKDLTSSFYHDVSSQALSEERAGGLSSSVERGRQQKKHVVKIPATLSHRERPLTRHSPIVEVDSGFHSPRTPRRHTTFGTTPTIVSARNTSSVNKYNSGEFGWSIRLRSSRSLKSLRTNTSEWSDYEDENCSCEGDKNHYDGQHLRPRAQSVFYWDSSMGLPSRRRPLTGAKALREKSPVAVNEVADTHSVTELDEPPHCDPHEYLREGGAIRRPTWCRLISEADKKEEPNDDWAPHTSGLDTSGKRVQDTVARERSQIDRKNNRTEKLYTAPDAFVARKSDKEATIAGDPFSANRSFDLPKGDGMKIRKSSKGPTSFVEIKTDRDEFTMPPAEKLKKPPAKSATQFDAPEEREKIELPSLQTPIEQPRIHSPPSVATETLYECEYCPEVFAEVQHLEEHAKLHTIPPLECPKCPERFWDDQHLKEHVTVHVPPVECPACPERFWDEEELDKHKVVHAPKLPCPKCDEMFFTKKEMKKHVKIHDPSVKCPKCTELFFTEAEMLEHITIHDPKVECRDCDQLFFTESEMEIHWSEVHEKKHVCKKCGEAFFEESELLQHKPIHEPQIKCVADKCNWKFFSDEDNEQHFELYHKPHVKCSECPKMFFNWEELEHHYSYVHAEKFKCPKCDQWFINIEDVNHHLPVHDPQISCPECGEKFFTEDRMREHKTVHEKPFICPDCPESFYTEKELNRHTVIHKPQLKCPKCTEMFFTQEEVDVHLPIHKPQVKCIKCEEMFFSIEEMEAHLPIHFVKKAAPPPPPPEPEFVPPPLPELTEEETVELVVEETKIPTPVPERELDPHLKPRPAPRRKLPKFKKPPRTAIPPSRMEPEPTHDPLDYLAKYCIIVKDRVPLYKKVFRDTLERQKSRMGIDYEDEEDEVVNKFRLMRRAKSGAIKVDPETGELSDPTVSIVNPDDLPKTEGEEDDGPQREEFEGDFDPRLNVDLELTKKSVEYEHYLMNQRELLNKINFTISNIESRQVKMSQDNMQMEKERVKLICQFARNELKEELFPKPEADSKKGGKKGGKDKGKKGKGKGGKKGKGPEPVEFPEWMNTELVEDVKSDEYVMARLDEDQWWMRKELN